MHQSRNASTAPSWPENFLRSSLKASLGSEAGGTVMHESRNASTAPNWPENFSRSSLKASLGREAGGTVMHRHAPVPERIDRAQLARKLLAQQFEGELGHRSRWQTYLAHAGICR